MKDGDIVVSSLPVGSMPILPLKSGPERIKAKTKSTTRKTGTTTKSETITMKLKPILPKIDDAINRS